jgi:hypothetical protein
MEKNQTTPRVAAQSNVQPAPAGPGTPVLTSWWSSSVPSNSGVMFCSCRAGRPLSAGDRRAYPPRHASDAGGDSIGDPRPSWAFSTYGARRIRPSASPRRPLRPPLLPASPPVNRRHRRVRACGQGAGRHETGAARRDVAPGRRRHDSAGRRRHRLAAAHGPRRARRRAQEAARARRHVGEDRRPAGLPPAAGDLTPDLGGWVRSPLLGWGGGVARRREAPNAHRAQSQAASPPQRSRPIA